jgi:predicted secreted protein
VSTPAILYDDSASPPQQIATVRLTVQRRADHAPVRNKADGGWEILLDGAFRTVSVRLLAEGVTSQGWIDTLLARWEAGEVAAYHVDLEDGATHAGYFAVAQLDEDAAAQNRRRFSLVLRSSGPISYAPGP